MKREEEFSREIEAHLDLEAARLESQGVPAGEARAAARRAFGNVTAARERFHESGRWRWAERLGRDAAYAVRGLRASPAFTVTALLTLAGGIGFNTALFSLLYSLGVRSLPVPEPERVATVFQEFSGRVDRMVNGSVYMLAWNEYLAQRDQNRSFESLAAHAQIQATLGGERAQTARVTLASCNYFSTLRVRVARGRGFVADDCARSGGLAVALVSDAFWRAHFGADSGVIGKIALLNQLPFDIIGVVEPGFGGTDLLASDLWVPVTMQPVLTHGTEDQLVQEMSWLNVTGRLKPGVRESDAAADLTIIARQLDSQHPGRETRVLVQRGTFGNNPEMRQRGGIIALGVLGLGGLVVLIACANLMNLLLARALTRRRELGIRLALGAGRRRLIGQLLTESLLLSILGGAAGLVLAERFPRFLLGLLPLTGLQLDLHPDLRILGFALLTSVLAALAFGLAPAFRATDLSLTAALRNEGTGSHGPRGTSRMRNAVVAVQMGGSTLLLVLAALFVRGMQRVASMDPGFATRGIIGVSINPGELGYDSTRAQAVYEELALRFRALPAVESLALASRLPFLGRLSTPVLAENPAAGSAPTNVQVDFLEVSSAYFSTMSLPIVRGRTFTPTEAVASRVRPVVVSETFARRAWPALDPIGRRFRIGESAYLVIGVARDVHNVSLGDPDGPFVYFPKDASGLVGVMGFTIILRTADPAAVMRSIPAIVRQVDPAFAMRIETMEERLALVALPTRLAGMLSGLFGLLALAMAVIGVYGVVSYGVSLRRREIGIRLALGATRRDVTALVVRQALVVAGIGVGVGLVVAAGASQLVRSLLFGLSPLDPGALMLAIGLLAAVAGIAMLAPARRAARIDPAVTLREE
jgi:predicted permease